MPDNELVERLKKNEGLSLTPYQDHLGNWTIGYGHLLGDGKEIKITKEDAEVLFYHDLVKAFKNLHKIKTEYWAWLSQEKKYVLVEMLFIMGLKGVLSFKKMLKALKERDLDKAANELLDSRFHQQVPKRAEELAQILKRKDREGPVKINGRMV